MRSILLSELAESFDAFLIDQFGVLLDGKGAYPGAKEALQTLTDMGKPIIILTNSGKRCGHTIERLTGFGIPSSCFSDVVSSGEVARQHLVDLKSKNQSTLRRIWYHADTLHASPLEGLGVELVERPEYADLLVIASVPHRTMTLAEYQEVLAPAAEQGIPCLCTNPDLVQLTPTGKSFSAGLVAQVYHEMGGPTEWIGKPFTSIYEVALKRLSSVTLDRVVCIGDSLEHDICGGHRAGLTTVLVRTGIHADITDDALVSKCHELGVLPDFSLKAFRWS